MVGDKRAALYRRLGISSVGDLVTSYPRRYEDLTAPKTVFEAIEGEICCISVTIIADAEISYTAKNRLIIRSFAEDDTGSISLTFFNNKYIAEKLKKGRKYLIYGKVISSLGQKSMLSPQLLKPELSGTFQPVYNLTAGLTNNMFRQNVKDALKLLPENMGDSLPESILSEYDLSGLKDALLKIHFPKSEKEIYSARKRLVFDELLKLSLGMKMLKLNKQTHKGQRITDDYTDTFIKSLPYELTNSQKSAIQDCINDMRSGNSMARLLQGDVGSGKTCVAAAVCYNAVKSGMQCAFMAPTEILATQHYHTLSEQLSKLDVNTALLTGSTTPKNKNLIKQKLSTGEIDLIIGTHALLTDNVEFKNLGLAVTDEQHRFGVQQRSKLLAKGNDPHFLIMSATPIPRTLAMMLYGDLDISVMNEMPKNRKQTETFFINGGIRHRAYNFLKKHIKSGRQCYIICPSVEENEMEIASAEEYYQKLKNGEFKGYSVALLHGKMKAKEKDSVMKAFSEGKIQLLVSTTVVEVGVDVPNATVIMIENAERFGLSQLHQLRGRVGRGKHQSYCILVSDSKGEESIKRLKILCDTTDGFKIADFDLKLRGPGDFFGSRQSGLPILSIADLSDTEMLKCALKASKQISNDGLQKPEYSYLRAEIRQMFDKINRG